MSSKRKLEEESEEMPTFLDIIVDFLHDEAMNGDGTAMEPTREATARDDENDRTDAAHSRLKQMAVSRTMKWLKRERRHSSAKEEEKERHHQPHHRDESSSSSSAVVQRKAIAPSPGRFIPYHIKREEVLPMDEPDISTDFASTLYYPGMLTPFNLAMFRFHGGRLPEDAVLQFGDAGDHMNAAEHQEKYKYTMEISSRTAPRKSSSQPEGTALNPTIDLNVNQHALVERRATITYQRQGGITWLGTFFPGGDESSWAEWCQPVAPRQVKLECVAVIRKKGDRFLIRIDCPDEPECWAILESYPPFDIIW